MKDSEFIELLNLYLDHEISAADAARLETEVQSSPARHQVYLQYCRMQKACTVLAKDFAIQSAAAEADGRKIVAFEPQSRNWGPSLWAAGGLVAAAACVALVFVTRAPAPTASSDSLAVAAPAVVSASVTPAATFTSGTSPNPAAQIARMVALPMPRRSDLQPVMPTRGLTLANQNVIDDPAAVAEVAAKFDWIAGLQIAPMQRVQVEDLRFENRPAQSPRVQTYGAQRRPEQGVVELTAFQFQK
jgi:hypothetical protein